MTFKPLVLDTVCEAFSNQASAGESQPTKEYETISLTLPVELVKQMSVPINKIEPVVILPQQKVKEKYLSLLRKKEKILKDIASLQQSCFHTDRLKEHQSNTGNFDPSDDCYWIKYTCPDCGLVWDDLLSS